ncbi:MAG: aminodeoxychorismate synthase component I [Alphaproteobacteria bacterium GM202ARS2]|nr:aminodeoxychorismate synthase component I [Alphaproteobacteria bacterium GM202ARS2]
MGTAVITLESPLGGLESLLALHRREPMCYPHLCASTACASRGDNYSILFAFPDTTLVLEHDYRLRENGVEVDGTFLARFDGLWQQARHKQAGAGEATDTGATTKGLPFRGGWFVYCGYELISQYETLALPRVRSDFPCAFAVRIPAAVIYHHESDRLFALSEEDDSCRSRLRAIQRAVDSLKAAEDGKPSRDTPVAPSAIEEDSVDAYYAAHQKCLDYIYAGDVFQVNLSRLWHLPSGAPSAYDLFYRLWRHNPSPFAALSVWHDDNGDKAIVSSSPERLVRVCPNGRIETRPIAGTRPRAQERLRDTEQSRVLLAHPKERAEHIMLVDLERNDLSKLCLAGSVRVDEMMVLESYAHVHHIVSNVCGRLLPNVCPGQVVAAVFPGGTITGCPKLRCIEILAELEAVGRGAYTGSLGYVNHDGSLDLNILIRTIVCEGDSLSFRAGGGIVADSQASHELEETRAKARGMIHALSRG